MYKNIVKNILNNDIFKSKLNKLFDEFVELKHIKIEKKININNKGIITVTEVNYNPDYKKLYNKVGPHYHEIIIFFNEYYSIQQSKKDKFKYIQSNLLFYSRLDSYQFDFWDYENYSNNESNLEKIFFVRMLDIIYDIYMEFVNNQFKKYLIPDLINTVKLYIIN
jgi:hypothetical protein